MGIYNQVQAACLQLLLWPWPSRKSAPCRGDIPPYQHAAGAWASLRQSAHVLNTGREGWVNVGLRVGAGAGDRGYYRMSTQGPPYVSEDTRVRTSGRCCCCRCRCSARDPRALPRPFTLSYRWVNIQTHGRSDRWEMSATYLSKKTRPSNSTRWRRLTQSAALGGGAKKKKKTEISDTVSPLIALLAARGAGGILQIFCVWFACVLQDLKSESCSAQNEKCDVDFDLKPYKYLLRLKNHRGFFSALKGSKSVISQNYFHRECWPSRSSAVRVQLLCFCTWMTLKKVVLEANSSCKYYIFSTIFNLFILNSYVYLRSGLQGSAGDFPSCQRAKAKLASSQGRSL